MHADEPAMDVRFKTHLRGKQAEWFYVLSMPYMWEYEVLLWLENPSHPPALQGFHATL